MSLDFITGEDSFPMAVDKKLLKQLKDNDPKVRRKAIVALADCRDLAAIAPLNEVIKNDPEAKLREVAQRAIVHLREQAERATAFAASAEAKNGAERPVVVSEKDRQRAKIYVEESMSMYLAKDMAKATRSLANALRINPNLKTDSYFLSMVGNVFNTSGEEGLAKLLDGEQRGEFITQANKGKLQARKDKHRSQAEEIGWTAALFDLGVYALIVFVLSFLAPFVITQLVNSRMANQALMTPEELSEEMVVFPSDVSTMTANVESAGAGALLVTALVNGGSSVLGLLLYGAVVHVVATKLLGGNGTLPYMLTQLVPFYSMMLPVFFIWSCLLLGMVSIGAALFAALCGPVMGLASLAVVFKAAGRIGKAYDFGAGKGCLSMMGASLLLAIIGFVLTNALLGALLNGLTGTVV